MRKRKHALAAILAAASLAVAVPTGMAAPNTNNQSGGVAGLVAALVQVNAQDVLTNFLNGSNVNVQVVSIPVNLTNVLNNNTILSNNTVIIQDLLKNFLNNNSCSVVAVCTGNIAILNNALNNLTLTIGQVVGVNVLSGTNTFVFYVLPPA